MTKVAIIGAGIGGLVAALLLAAKGCEVVVCEAAEVPGGKLREVMVQGKAIDVGPTVFTLRDVFEGIFDQAGARLAEHVTLTPLECMARHAWEEGPGLDLFADVQRSVEAIGDFAGAGAARRYAEFAKVSGEIFETLDKSFMQIPQPGLTGLVRRAGPGLMGISPFNSLWQELGKYFAAPKLRQLFARYATYCGSSPFEAPATLMLIAHAEQRGVWRIEGGMARLAYAIEALAKNLGARFVYGERVTEVLVRGGRVAGVRRANGEQIAADFVVANADVAALDAGLFGAAAKAAVKGMMQGAKRSLSAVTWAGVGVAEGMELAHHNVFFSRDYAGEFAELGMRRLPEDPTVYLCASGEGRYFVLVNAAAGSAPTEGEIQQCLRNTVAKMEACGLKLRLEEMECTGPAEFGARFPQTGGALYGRALAGWRDSFQRPGAKTRLPGLLLAGGSVHPGPGLPMAAISGRIAAQCVLTGK